jgi:hypothetical protein
MKTIFRIVLILLVAALVAGGYNLAFGSSSGAASNLNGQARAFGTNSGQAPFRPDGGERDGGASTAGLLGVFVTLTKLAVIIGLVLALQKGLSLLLNRKTRAAGAG